MEGECSLHSGKEPGDVFNYAIYTSGAPKASNPVVLGPEIELRNFRASLWSRKNFIMDKVIHHNHLYCIRMSSFFDLGISSEEF